MRRLTLEENRPMVGFRRLRSKLELGLRIVLGFETSSARARRG